MTEGAAWSGEAWKKGGGEGIVRSQGGGKG